MQTDEEEAGDLHGGNHHSLGEEEGLCILCQDNLIQVRSMMPGRFSVKMP
jgi:hypothetical protein